MASSGVDVGIVLSTAASKEQAAAIARALIDERLAACVNIVNSVRSIYLWKGQVCDDAECLLVVKTSVALFPRLRDAIRRLHSYETPEIVLLRVTDTDPSYRAWLDQCLAPEPPGD